MTVPTRLSLRAQQTGDQPISYFMQQAVENPRLISLAAGLVDAGSLPAGEIQNALDHILGDPQRAQAALQYGTTQGYAPLREKLVDRLAMLDGISAAESSLRAEDVVITTGSQQLLYLVAEMLVDPGDIVIVEAPSYFVFGGALTSMGARVMSVPMDDDGMNTDALADMLAQLQRTGELDRVRLIYVTDYFQNPTGLTLSLPRRQHIMELARRYSRKHRLIILEDAAYRELRYEGPDLPSIKSFDSANEHVILGMTLSKPLAPGLKSGYGYMPRDLVTPLLRFKGNHDFGSSNLTQHLVDRVLETGAYDRHVAHLCDVYRGKRDAMLETLAEEFGPECRWTEAGGGLYVWLTFPDHVDAGPDSRLMRSALHEGVLYVPGQFCYMSSDATSIRRNEARLSFGVAAPEQLREGIRRLARAYRTVCNEMCVGNVTIGV